MCHSPCNTRARVPSLPTLPYMQPEPLLAQLDTQAASGHAAWDSTCPLAFRCGRRGCGARTVRIVAWPSSYLIWSAFPPKDLCMACAAHPGTRYKHIGAGHRQSVASARVLDADDAAHRAHSVALVVSRGVLGQKVCAVSPEPFLELGQPTAESVTWDDQALSQAGHILAEAT